MTSPVRRSFHLPQGGNLPRHVLMEAIVKLMGSLDLPSVLQEFVDQTCALTGAAYGALSILDSRGETTAFFYHGVNDEQARIIGHPPVGRGMIGSITTDDLVIINDIESSDQYTGFPEGHPIMSNFLGTVLRVRDQVYGRIYLCDKKGGFTEGDARDIRAMASIAAIAVENSRLYQSTLRAEKWMAASQNLTTVLLQGADEEEALSLITNTVRDVAHADTAIMILPSVGDTWAAEIVEGEYASHLLGVVFPEDGRAQTVLKEGRGMLVDAMERALTLRVPELRHFGPALYAPLMAGDTPKGVLLLMRLPDKQEFTAQDLTQAESLAAQATLALELAGAKHAEDVAALLDERNRIGQDLHDLAIQQLFATGMTLDRIREKAINDDDVTVQDMISGLDDALAAVDDSVRQIRQIVHNLREPDQAVELVERLRREASIARTALGYAPSFIIQLNGKTIRNEELDTDSQQTMMIEDAISADLADDVVAVVREALSNTARHAHATSVSVLVDIAPEPDKKTTTFSDPHVVITVTDDGRGIDPTVTRRSGIANLEARARRQGGWTQVTSDSSGTELYWCALIRQL